MKKIIASKDPKNPSYVKWDTETRNVSIHYSDDVYETGLLIGTGAETEDDAIKMANEFTMSNQAVLQRYLSLRSNGEAIDSKNPIDSRNPIEKNVKKFANIILAIGIIAFIILLLFGIAEEEGVLIALSFGTLLSTSITFAILRVLCSIAESVRRY